MRPLVRRRSHESSFAADLDIRWLALYGPTHLGGSGAGVALNLIWRRDCWFSLSYFEGDVDGAEDGILVGLRLLRVATLHDILDHAVFKAMVGDHYDASARLDNLGAASEHGVEGVHLVVYLDAQCLEDFGKRLVLIILGSDGLDDLSQSRCRLYGAVGTDASYGVDNFERLVDLAP